MGGQFGSHGLAGSQHAGAQLGLTAGRIDGSDRRRDPQLAGHAVDSHRSELWSHSRDRPETCETKTIANFYRMTGIGRQETLHDCNR
jgi:hypothetical protein